MRLLAAVLVGVAVATATGLLSGTVPTSTSGRRSQRRPDPERVRSVLGSIAAAAVAWFLLTLLTGSVAVGVVPAIALGALPQVWWARHQRAGRRAVQAAWPDGLRDLAASVAAGQSLGQAVEHLARSGPVPLREPFARFARTRRMAGTVAALEGVREQLADPTSDRVIEVLVVAHERGGRMLGRVLDDLAAATTRDLRLADELDSAGLEMRINARAVVVLPWLVLVALTAREGPFRDFYSSARGFVVLLVGATLTALGAFLVARLGRVVEEPRVLGRSRGAGATPT